MPSHLWWFKMPTSLRSDPRVRGLTDRQFRTYVNLLCLARECKRPGRIEASPGKPYTERALADALGIRGCHLRPSVDALIAADVGGLAREADGTLVFRKWEEYQAPVTSAERTERYRNRLRQGAVNRVSDLRSLDGQEPVTTLSEGVQPVQSAACDQIETRPGCDVTVTPQSRERKEKDIYNPPTPLHPTVGGGVPGKKATGKRVPQWLTDLHEQHYPMTVMPSVLDELAALLALGVTETEFRDAYAIAKSRGMHYGYVQGVLRRKASAHEVERREKAEDAAWEADCRKAGWTDVEIEQARFNKHAHGG